MVFFDEKKGNFVGLYLKYKVPCHHTAKSYDLLSEISKNMYMQKLNDPNCNQDNRILRLTFIGKLNDINKFQSNLIEEKVNKELIFLTKKNINEMQELLYQIKEINLPELTELKKNTKLNLKEHKIHEYSNIQFEIFEKKILNKIDFLILNFHY